MRENQKPAVIRDSENSVVEVLVYNLTISALELCAMLYDGESKELDESLDIEILEAISDNWHLFENYFD